jgi:hypothetical protein
LYNHVSLPPNVCCLAPGCSISCRAVPRCDGLCFDGLCCFVVLLQTRAVLRMHNSVLYFTRMSYECLWRCELHSWPPAIPRLVYDMSNVLNAEIAVRPPLQRHLYRPPLHGCCVLCQPSAQHPTAVTPPLSYWMATAVLHQLSKGSSGVVSSRHLPLGSRHPSTGAQAAPPLVASGRPPSKALGIEAPCAFGLKSRHSR